MPQVRLGGNKASGANRMYFCLIHAHGDLTGRVSAPPGLVPPPPVSLASGVASLEDAAFFSARGVPAFGNEGGGGDGGGNQGDEVAVESTDHSQLFRFWDSEANGKLVQAPLDLDRQGRGWCKVCMLPPPFFSVETLVGRVGLGLYGKVAMCVRACLVCFPRFRV